MESVRVNKELVFKNKNAKLYPYIKEVSVEIDKENDTSALHMKLEIYDNTDKEVLIEDIKELTGIKWIVPTETADRESANLTKESLTSNNGLVQASVSREGYRKIMMSNVDINSPLPNIDYEHIYKLIQRNWMDEIPDNTRILKDADLYQQSDFTLYKKYKGRKFRGIHAVVDSEKENDVASPITLIERFLKVLTKDKMTRSGISYNKTTGGLMYFVKYMNSDRKEILITLLLPQDITKQNVTLEILHKYLEQDLLSNVDLRELTKEI